MIKRVALFASVLFVITAGSASAAVSGVLDGGGGKRPNCTAYSPYYTWTGADGYTWTCVPTGGGSWGWR